VPEPTPGNVWRAFDYVQGMLARAPSRLVIFVPKQKPPAFASGFSTNSDKLLFVQQHAFGFFRVYGAVEQLIALEEDLDERRPRGDRALNQCLG
jgi:hypothetical protein